MSFTRIIKGRSKVLPIPGEVILTDEQKAKALRAEAERSRTMPGTALSPSPTSVNENAPHPPRPEEAGTVAAARKPPSGRLRVDEKKLPGE